MKSNRDMFYPGMMNPMMPGMPGMAGTPGMGMPGTSAGMSGPSGMGMPSSQWTQGYNTATAGDLERRVDMLERQVKRLDTRVTRLETPYTGGQYPSGQYTASGQFTTQPYSTSAQNPDYMSTNYPNSMHMM